MVCVADDNGGYKWAWKGCPEPRPLYRLDQVSANPDKKLLVCEGEKAADAAAERFPEYIATTSMGGAKAAERTDWSACAGRILTIWPDNDDAGRKYARKVADLARKAGAQEVRIAYPDNNWPKGWDAADPNPDGVVDEDIRGWLDGAEVVLESPGVSFPLKGAQIPKGFDLNHRGVFAVETNKDGKSERRWICSPIAVKAMTRSGASEEWGRLVRLLDPDGVLHEFPVPMELFAGSGLELRQILLDQGLQLAPGNKAKLDLERYLSSCDVSNRALCVNQVGWYEANYVLWDQVIGPAGSELIVLQNGVPGNLRLSRQGSPEEWREQVAGQCAGNSRLVFAISLAFAGPLLKLVDECSGGFHLVGPSSTGKTTALQIAASVWGGDEQLKTWRTTSNGLEAVAAGHNDGFLAIDELSQVTPSEAAESAYMLANGKGKMRANRRGRARIEQTWRLVFLSTGEVGIADKIEEDGRRRATAGQQVRVVGVPADAGEGLGIFDVIPPDTDAGQFVSSLRDAAGRNHGHAGPEFVHNLTNDLSGAADVAKTRQREFVDQYCPEGADGQVRRVAQRFGLVAAAGELAAEFGVVPWKKGESMKAAVRCFQDWLAARGGIGPAEVTAGLQQVRLFIQQHAHTRFDAVGEELDPNSSNRVGFKQRDEEGNWEFFVFAQAWTKVVCEGLDARFIARELCQRGFIVPDAKGKPSVLKKFKGCKKGRYYHVSSRILGDETSAT